MAHEPGGSRGGRIAILVAALLVVVGIVLFALTRGPGQEAARTMSGGNPPAAPSSPPPAAGPAPGPAAATPAAAGRAPAPARESPRAAARAARAPAPPPSVNAPGVPPEALPPGHPALSAADEKSQVTLQWLGEDCFYIQSPGGIAVVTDPFDPAAAGLPAANTGAHLITVSSGKPEHNDASTVHAFQGEAKRVLHGESAQRGDLRVTPVPLGTGEFAYRIEAGGLRIAHLGGIRGTLTPEQARQLGPLDLLLLPVGDGRLTPAAAVKVAQALAPRVVIPMGYATRSMPEAAQHLGSVDAFVKASPYPRTDRETDVMLVSPADLPPKTEIWTLRYGH